MDINSRANYDIPSLLMALAICINPCAFLGTAFLGCRPWTQDVRKGVACVSVRKFLLGHTHFT